MKEKLKVYHGLPKTPTNENTLFYASFDGNADSNLGSVYPECMYAPSITGYGASTTQTETYSTQFPLNNKNGDKKFTFDFWGYLGTSNVDFLNLIDEQNLDSSNVNHTRRCLTIYYNVNVGLRFTYFPVRSANSVEFFDIPNTYNVGWVHIRLLVDGLTTKLYVNGKHQVTATVHRPFDSFFIGKAIGYGTSVLNPIISDFHITSDYMEDCFPTLPQDFIDGKAIVVPALNQRQSYGDPVLHQVTELLVPCSAEHYGSMDSNTGLYTSVKNPELSVDNYATWREGARIRIEGLQNSVITGVFDTDTAKCRVIKDTTSDRYIHVDSVSGLSVGDTVQIRTNNLIDSYTWTGIATITEIDTTNNTFKTDLLNGYPPKGCYVFETTVSSSSPVVKTVDGTTVNGTWSGLGTSEATFRIMENSNIAGKDLVVTYCLNAIGNSSPYPKMPSEVIRGYNELGHELIPANGIVIQDDFKGKISGSILECPHTLKYALDSVLRLPSHYWNEFTQSYYNTPPSIASHVQGHIAQILVEVDLVRFIENKMGVEIPGNKLNWLNNNIKNITCRALVRGNNDTNNNCYIKYMGKGNSWSLNSSGATSNSSSAKLIVASWSPTGLLSSTKSYFLIHSDALSVAGNDNLKSRVVLSDVQLELTFNIDERYDYLYTKDLASRCDGYANPILVDKQTKEVKRLLPSTAPFSTEVLTYNSGNITSLSNCTLITQSNTHMLTTMGTGSSDPFVENQYRGLLGKLDLAYFNSADYLGEPAYRLPLGANTSRFSLGCKFVLSQAYMENMNFFQISEVFPNVNQLAIKHGIVKKDTELYLRLLVLGIKANSLDYTSSIQYYKLPNRPLIK